MNKVRELFIGVTITATPNAFAVLHLLCVTDRRFLRGGRIIFSLREQNIEVQNQIVDTESGFDMVMHSLNSVIQMGVMEKITHQTAYILGD